MTDPSPDLVDELARMLAKSRTHGNVYMDCSHNPLPTEIKAAQRFVSFACQFAVDEESAAWHDELGPYDTVAEAIAGAVARERAKCDDIIAAADAMIDWFDEIPLPYEAIVLGAALGALGDQP